MARSNVFTKLPDDWINMSENQFCRLTHQLKAFGENPFPGTNLQHPDYIEYNNMISEFNLKRRQRRKRKLTEPKIKKTLDCCL